MADVFKRHRITSRGSGSQVVVFAHGFGCDQLVWSDVAPAFEADYRVVTFDHVGCGLSDRRAYRPERHGSLKGYALDLLDVIDAVTDQPVVLVGHSVSGTIGLLASILLPDRFRHVVAVHPSPRYTNDGQGYVGGMETADVEAMLEQMELDTQHWADTLAPLVMENAHRPELTERLTRSFLSTDPDLLRAFARTVFLSDVRHELSRVTVPVDIFYSLSDAVVPVSAINYLARRLPDVECTSLDASGHYPQLSAPEELIRKLQQVFRRRLTPAP